MERIMVVPLRKARRGSKSRFAPKAIRFLKEFVKRHMKASEVKIGNELNEFVWSRGIKNPPRRVEVRAFKKENVAYVEIASISEEKWKKFVGLEEEKKAKELLEETAKESGKSERKGEKSSEKKEKKGEKESKGKSKKSGSKSKGKSKKGNKK